MLSVSQSINVFSDQLGTARISICLASYQYLHYLPLFICLTHILTPAPAPTTELLARTSRHSRSNAYYYLPVKAVLPLNCVSINQGAAVAKQVALDW